MITTETKDLSNIDYSGGEVLLIDKELGGTSFDVVKKLRRILGIKKIGHAGTLDPKATGLLIICTGRKTKEIEKFQAHYKEYTGIIGLGARTPSMDTETEPIEVKEVEGITEEKILAAKEKFIGEIQQTPPMFSAIKHKGKSLYKYARKGDEVKREPRTVFIENFEITKINLPDVYFKVECSKGTYLRVIADDFGAELGCGGYLKYLRRTKIGDYPVEQALTVKNVESLVLQ